MKAEIVSIGTEILLGDIINTNAQFISKELALLGIDMYYQSVVGDNQERILETFHSAFKRCDLVITTGGLGPTQDDITKEMVAKYFNRNLNIDNNALHDIKEYLSRKGKELSKSNEKQAYFPEGAIILNNSCGTAPGCIIEENNKVLIVLPGPPNEMEAMFNEKVKPYLQEKCNTIIKSKTLRVFGIGESYMSEKVDDIIKNSKNPTVAPYAKDVDVILRITTKGENEEECIKLINPVKERIQSILGENVYGEDDQSLEEVLGSILCKNNLTISTAESCTGGMIAAKLINYPGISSVLLEGAVTYSNEAKMKRLGVKKQTLDEFGAVSKETAEEMARGICKAAGTKVSIVSTGIAGPGGGTKEKPVGLVYLGIYVNNDVFVKKCLFQGDRQNVRIKATMTALDMLRRELLRRGYNL